jgi:hypothetical protein
LPISSHPRLWINRSALEAKPTAARIKAWNEVSRPKLSSRAIPSKG